MTRREMLRWMGVSSALAATGKAFAASSPRDDKTVSLPQREIPVLHKTQVLVVGGGCAGFCAAIGAAKTGVHTILVERYGQLGGLFTSGIVPLIIGTRINGGKTLCVRGVGGEMMDRLQAMKKGIIGYEATNPTVDVEATKWLMVEMLKETGVTLLYHSWCVDAVMDGSTIQGAIFQSKQGRFAILADAVVDTSGDGDVFAMAGAAHVASTTQAGVPFRVINLNRAYDAQPAQAFRKDLQKKLKDHVGSYVGCLPTPLPGVTWHNQDGLRINPLNLEDLTKAECRNRKRAWTATEFIQKQPKCEPVEMIEVAPMLGVRSARILEGVHKMSPDDMRNKTPRPDAIGINPGLASGIPYGILIPKDVENLTVGGRCVSAESGPSGTLRLVPYCMLTGHAAGVGAALAAKHHMTPGKLDVDIVRKTLEGQGAFLGMVR